jgi:hypothetical protein
MEQLQSHIWLTASTYMVLKKYLRISSYIRKPFLIYEFATAPFWISLYIRKIWFFFISEWWMSWGCLSVLAGRTEGSSLGECHYSGGQRDIHPHWPPSRLQIHPQETWKLLIETVIYPYWSSVSEHVLKSIGSAHVYLIKCRAGHRHRPSGILYLSPVPVHSGIDKKNYTLHVHSARP